MEELREVFVGKSVVQWRADRTRQEDWILI